MNVRGLVEVNKSVVEKGTYQKLDPKSTNENYFEYLDHVFVSQSHLNFFRVIYDDYVINIDHKPCQIAYNNV